MIKIEDVLEWLSKKEWILRKDWKQVKKYLEKNSEELEDIKTIKRYNFLFREPLFFEHDLTTYKTGRIFANYVLLPNKPVLGIKLKELILPKEGYVFVSFDFKGSQIRHMAVYKDLKKIKKMFEKDIDVYSEFGKMTKIEERDICKKVMLLLSYGGNAKTIKKEFDFDLTDKQIEKAIEVYQEWFEVDSSNYKKNVELSHIIQKKEADFMKKKLIRLFEKQSEKYNIHAFIHDDIICEVNEKNLDHIEKIKKFLEKNDEIKMRVDVKISKTFQFK